jgi:hypothetical protein
MSKRLLICISVLLLTVMALFGWAVHVIWGPDTEESKRVVARAITLDGTELCVIQRPNPGSISMPFSTHVYFHKPGKQWEGFYYDHKDYYWDRAATEIDPVAKRITVFRHGKRAISFDWESEIYRKWDGARVSRVFTNAELQLSASWTPEHSIRP